MRIRSNLKGTKGWLYMQERSIRFRYMITETAKKRTTILTFWKKHGLEAVEEAYGVSKRTLYRWQKALKKGQGQLETLNSGSRTPGTKRRRIWSPNVLEELRRIRYERPNLGKEKLFPLIQKFCIENRTKAPSVRTVGRLIKDLGGLRMVPLRITGTGRIKPLVRIKALRKPKGLVARYPGHVVALDTFEEHINGTRRYVITFIDLYTRFGFAFATSSHASLAAADFFALCRAVFPFPFIFVLTDNGSEFKKHFSATLLDLHLIHYHTRPRTPKQNAHAERFNRTVQEEFANYHRHDLWVDIDSFNRKLFAWLFWYNSERVHFAFQNKLSPLQFMLSLDPKTLPAECQSGWPHTHTCVRQNEEYNTRMKDTGKGLLKDLFTLTFLIVVIVIPVRIFIVSPFIVDGASMHPTFKNLDYLIVDELLYRFSAPARGDVIVFRYPGNPSIFYIKRVIGLPNETVSIRRGVVTITTVTGESVALDEPYIVNEDATYTKNISLSPEEYFVMGDNRPNSSDSRVWGPLPRKDIVGRVDLRLLPINQSGFFPGKATYATPSTIGTTTGEAL